ncbi:hypothetical protein Amal_03750 [Acetobacter malorum]|uniref:Uncharacterized protein n=1 Tax=Acetobacter malorum TaxID=178901 RepID=A0A177G758_9PROT|nr:hypothetical protein Amal_03750 [Acetobacter malorum]
MHAYGKSHRINLTDKVFSRGKVLCHQQKCGVCSARCGRSIGKIKARRSVPYMRFHVA